MTTTPETTTITHLAGPLMTFGQHQRQRCVWCGYVIEDHDLTRVAVKLNDDGSHPGGPGGWAEGTEVRITQSGGFRHMQIVDLVPHPEHEGQYIAADDSCMRLPAELTLAVEGRSE